MTADYPRAYSVFQCDIFGQIVKKIEYFKGGWYNPEQAQAYERASAQDRVTQLVAAMAIK